MYGLRVSALRLTNTYGPRMRVKDARQTFLGYWLRMVVEQNEFVVFGDGSQLRDFNFVDDVVDAFLVTAADESADGRVYNLGAEPAVSLGALAELLVSVAGCGTFRVVPFPPDRKAIDIGDYFADASRIRSELGWVPRIDLEEGLRRSVAFFREHIDRYVGTA